jgi:hypothetical protein
MLVFGPNLARGRLDVLDLPLLRGLDGYETAVAYRRQET